MIDLDDPGALRRADPSGMLDAVLRMPAQCEQGFRAGRQAGELPSGDSASSVVVCGMGGSGVAGDVLGALYRDRLGIPIVTVKDFSLPEFCGKDTVVVCSSYSGSTAETLACFEEATARGCRVLATASGGELADRAGAADIAVVPIPAGLQPRAAIGHLVFALLGALEEMGDEVTALLRLGPLVRVIRHAREQAFGDRGARELRVAQRRDLGRLGRWWRDRSIGLFELDAPVFEDWRAIPLPAVAVVDPEQGELVEPFVSVLEFLELA